MLFCKSAELPNNENPNLPIITQWLKKTVSWSEKDLN